MSEDALDRDGFDPKDWINQELQKTQSDQGGGTATRQLSSLVIRLQLQEEDSMRQAQNCTQELFAATPRALERLGQARQEAEVIKTSLKEVVSDLVSVESKTSSALKFLSQVPFTSLVCVSDLLFPLLLGLFMILVSFMHPAYLSLRLSY